jgi:1-deoxy-D-xylulose-5-phosphate reductoisomerase
MKNISVLGSTGSIGRSSLEVIEKLSHRFKVVGFSPKIVSVEKKEEAEDLRRKFKGKSIQVTFGQEGAEEVARFSENDIVISAITGIDGLRPTLAAVQEGKKWLWPAL